MKIIFGQSRSDVEDHARKRVRPGAAVRGRTMTGQESLNAPLRRRGL